jgi:hypothetical protein
MKSAGLSSKFRKMFKQTSRTALFASQQEAHLGEKAKQKSQRLQAQFALIERKKREAELSAPVVSEPTHLS